MEVYSRRAFNRENTVYRANPIIKMLFWLMYLYMKPCMEPCNIHALTLFVYMYIQTCTLFIIVSIVCVFFRDRSQYQQSSFPWRSQCFVRWGEPVKCRLFPDKFVKGVSRTSVRNAYHSGGKGGISVRNSSTTYTQCKKSLRVKYQLNIQ